jgi:hypothetical protein
VAWGKEFTEEALLAGLWVLLAVVAAFKERLPEELRQLADFIVSGSDTG